MVDIRKLALTLTEQERATLAASLLESLPGVLSNEDAGIAEALSRCGAWGTSQSGKTPYKIGRVAGQSQRDCVLKPKVAVLGYLGTGFEPCPTLKGLRLYRFK